MKQTKVPQHTEIRWRHRDIRGNQHGHQEREFRFIDGHFISHLEPFGGCAGAPDVFVALDAVADFVDGDGGPVAEVHYQAAVHDPHEEGEAVVSKAKQQQTQSSNKQQ